MHAIALRYTLASVFCVWLTGFSIANESAVETDPESGLIKDTDETWVLVEAHCGTACHSGKLVTQQRLDRESWQKSIKRMQSKEGLWNLLGAEPKILDYLSTFYGESEKPKNHRIRRAQLKQIDGPNSSPSDSKSSQVESDSSSNDVESQESNEIQSPEQEEESGD